jgi:hypothetical protein
MIPLTLNGAPKYQILLARTAPAAEIEAANELKYHLDRMVGRDRQSTAGFKIIREGLSLPEAPVISIGATNLALSMQIEVTGNSKDSWLRTTSKGNLFLLGASGRGTLYAVWHFLEDELGVHWWTPFADTVPEYGNLEVDSNERSGTPAFVTRTLSSFYHVDRRVRQMDLGRFYARNRINGFLFNHIPPHLGGYNSYGLPDTVHTFYAYIAPEKYFKEHPEWFALVDGKRQDKEGQLDLMNPELRKFFLESLRENIMVSHQADAAANRDKSVYFDISANDHAGFDEGPKSAELVAREGGESGPLLDFLNFLSDGIKDEFPEVILTTLAYKETLDPPKTICARDNIMVKFCDMRSSLVHPIDHPFNRFIPNLVEKWSKHASRLEIYFYASHFVYPRSPFPFPVLRNIAQELILGTSKGFESVQGELWEPVVGDLVDMKRWVLFKLMENPNQDLNALIAEFCHGYYGVAGDMVAQIYAKTAKLAEANKKPISAFDANFSNLEYLTVEFLQKLDGLWAQAIELTEKSTSDPRMIIRIKQARMSTDWAIIFFTNWSFHEDWNAKHPDKPYPFNRDAIAERYIATWQEANRWQIAPAYILEENQRAVNEVMPSVWRKLTSLPVPRELTGRKIYNYTAESFLLPPSKVKLIPDSSSDSGVAAQITFKSSPALTWNIFGLSTKHTPSGVGENLDNLSSKDYEWKKLGVFTTVERALLRAFPDDLVMVMLNNHPLFDSRHPEKEFELYLHLKMESKKENELILLVDRLVVSPIHKGN